MSEIIIANQKQGAGDKSPASDANKLLDKAIFSNGPEEDIVLSEFSSVKPMDLYYYICRKLDADVCDTEKRPFLVRSIARFADRLSRAVEDSPDNDGPGCDIDTYGIECLEIIVQSLEELLECQDYETMLMVNAAILQILEELEVVYATKPTEDDFNPYLERIDDTYGPLFSDPDHNNGNWSGNYRVSSEDIDGNLIKNLYHRLPTGAEEEEVISKARESGLVGDMVDLSWDWVRIILVQVYRTLGDSVFEISKKEASGALRFTTFSRTREKLRMREVLDELKGANRRLFLEAFLAIEFGEDFGGAIISIAENTSNQELEMTLGIINDFRSVSKEMAHWFGDFDPELESAIQSAMNERLTEALSLVELVAEEGPQTIDTAPNSSSPDYVHDGKFDAHYSTVEDVLKDMNIHRKGMILAQNILSDPAVVITKTVKEGQGFQIYRFSSQKHGEALLHVRREGSGKYDKTLEYGSAGGVEATVSLTVNPSNPFSLSVEKDPDGVSVFRLDREGRTSDEEPNAPERTPIREKGLISYDASSIIGDPNSNSVRAGRVFASGNKVRSNKLYVKPTLHHNTGYFDQEKWGASKGFASIVDHAIAMSEGLNSLQQPESPASRRQRLASTAVQAGLRPAA